MADAALRARRGAQEGRVVVGIDQKAQPGAQVADLGPVEEALAARDLVGQVGFAQRLLEQPCLVVGAVQHGEVPQLRTHTAPQRFDARHHAIGLVRFGVAAEQRHRVAVAELAPELFLEQLRVVRDHRVGRAQDAAGGSVVLLERDHLQLRVVGRQALQVLDRGAAPAVDALVVVSHGREQPALAGEQLEQLVLQAVGVLVFVDQHIAQHVLPVRAHLFVARDQLDRQGDEIVEVDGLVGRQALPVAAHHARRHEHLLAVAAVALAARARRVGLGFVGAPALAFPAADGPLPASCLCVVGAATGVFEDGEHVVAVEDGEARLQAEPLAVRAQQAHAERVEGADRELARRPPADECARPLAHLFGRLVGERDRGHLRRRVTGFEQARDFVHDHPRLARAGACEHKARPAQVVDGLELRGIQ